MYQPAAAELIEAHGAVEAGNGQQLSVGGEG
jgi:hypothetical protein